MDKYGAAPPGDAGTLVMVDFNDEIVEGIFAPQPVAWFNGRPSKRMIVAPVFGIFAPSIGLADSADWEHRSRGRAPVASPPQPQRPERAAGRPAIALALVGLNAGPAEGDRHAP